jgi:hypothetical protein
MGIDYETLDRISWGIDQGWETGHIAAVVGVTAEQVEHVREMRRRSEHLRTLPPVPALGSLLGRSS